MAARKRRSKVRLAEVACARLPLEFRALAGQFAKHFRTFAARAAVILDKPSDEILQDIHASREAQLKQYLTGDEYRIPRPTLAVSAVRRA